MKLLRIVAEWKDAPNSDEGRMTFDVLANADDVAEFKFVTFGAVGQLTYDPSVFWPFSLNQDGKMTYSGEDQFPETTHKINIFGKQIFVGQYFTFFSEDQKECTYQITRVLNLTEKMK